ncbi:hypothetical protein SpCBS45565_g05065 [Spizellomyces sp. 'palustris']|nr:hypothetical protein SpCBS45565_g05065 [Spizellomyces sp. 'palustris']
MLVKSGTMKHVESAIIPLTVVVQTARFQVTIVH